MPCADRTEDLCILTYIINMVASYRGFEVDSENLEQPRTPEEKNTDRGGDGPIAGIIDCRFQVNTIELTFQLQPSFLNMSIPNF
jgi:hypothetical protein